MTVVDHRAEMEDALSVAKGARGSALATEKILLAQAHATALLVEEQRVTNLITLIGFGEQLGHENYAAEDEALYQRVAKALGIS